nr:integrase, catalytic region, zinc finger, CCHC-type, peptidase aspartic, catalytic [Tanacetum cinerariifolium]
MNYLKEQTDGEAMINCIKNGDQPLPRVTQVSIAGTSSTEQPPLKDKFMCDLKKCGYSKDNCELNFKFLNNLKIKWKQFATMMRQNKNLMDVNIDALYNILKQNQGDVNDAMGLKKKTGVVTSDPLALIAEKMKMSKRKEKVVVSSDSEGDCKKAKVKDYEYYKTNMLLAKKGKDEQVLLAEDHACMESSSDSDQEIKANMVSYYLSESKSEYEYETSEYYNNTTTYGLFVNDNDDQENFHDCENFPKNLIESQLDHNESAIDHNDSERINKLIRKFNKMIAKCLKRIEKANQQNKDFKNQNKDLQGKYDVLKNQATTFKMKNSELNEQMKVLIEKNDDLLAQTNAERYEYMIRYSAYFDNDKQHRKQIANQEVLYDKMSVQLVELDKHVRDLKNTILEKDFKISELEECVRNKDLKIEKCLERLNDCENKLHKMGQTNQTVHMIMLSKDKMYNGRKGIGFENPSYFCKAKDLRPMLYDERVINLGYTLMFLTHSYEALEIEKFKRARENKIEFAYDYGNLNASYVNKKINFSDDYFQEIINLNFDKIDSLFQQTSSLKLYVPTVIFEKIIIDLEDEVVSLLEKEKANLETIESLKSKGFEPSKKVVSETENKSEHDFQVIEKVCDSEENPNVIAPGMFKINLDTLSSVRRPKPSGVMWMKKGLSNTIKADLSSDNHSNLNKNVKRYSRKNLMACNNSDTRSAFVCNNARSALCNARMNASIDVNDLFVFDDIVQIYLWITDSGCSKHMIGNRALLTNFVEKFLRTVRFGNNDFAMIVGYGDVVIESMTIKKVYYVEVI